MALRRNRLLVFAAALVPFLASTVARTYEAKAVEPPVGPVDDSAAPSPEPPTLADARDLLMQGSYEAAIEAYESLAKRSEHALDAALGLARCRLQIGQYQRTITDLAKLGADDSPEWHYRLAQLYARVGRYPKTLEQAGIAAKLDRNHAGARLLLADTLMLLGRRDEAVRAYRWFDQQLVGRPELPRDAAWLTGTGLGFLRYSTLTRTNLSPRTRHVLHEMLQVAYERVDRTYWPARIAAGDLLREKYNNAEEDGSVSDYRAALAINENLPDAHVGLGEVALERWDFEGAERHAEAAQSVNPNYAPAVHLLGKKLIVERRYREAVETCERALAVNANDVIALSISAAASACRYDKAAVDRYASRVAAINPTCSVFYRTLGNALSGIRQYPAAEHEFRKAIESDPTDANARTELGMMYMQWGREVEAREALEAAWALDSFNERTKFTLELLDMLDTFDRIETAHFDVKYDADQDPTLGEFIAEYMEEIHDPVTGDYSTSLAEKTIVEIFPTHRAFGVRITGKPWIHTIGASTGRVIAVASPRQSPQLAGTYNLARVLKHEFTHTVTLAATRNRIPHWMTEGLAVYQEDAPRSFWWCELLADAVRQGGLFTLESIDWAFVRPRRAEDRQIAYAQSEWMCEYIVDRFGYETILEMLAEFREGQTLDEVFREQLRLEPETFDRDFQSWTRPQVADWGFDLTPPEPVLDLRMLAAANGEDATIMGRLARAELDDRNYERALVAAGKALALDDNEPNGLEVLARNLTRRAKDAPNESARRAVDHEALPVLQRLGRVKPTSWIAPKYLADILLRRDDLEGAIEPLKRLQQLCPADPASWRGLSGIYLEQGKHDLALPQLLELARLDEADAKVLAGIGSIYKRRGRLHEARYWDRAALYIDPFNVKFQQALGDTCMQVGDTKAALAVYRRITRLEPENPKPFERVAFAAHKIGETEMAREYARKAVRLDPTSAARSLLP